MKCAKERGVKSCRVKNTNKKDKLNAIEKALEILVTFTDCNHELSTGEISKLTGIHKATASRILSSMVEYGLFAHNNESRKYSLGPLAYRIGLSQVSRSIQQFVDISVPYINRLRDSSNESISLEVWSGTGTVACYVAESRNALRVSMAPAEILPLHAPAGAKAIISYMHHDQVCKMLDYDFQVFTEHTITSKEVLLERLGQFNRQGYAVDSQELHDGIYAIGVPIFDHLSKPVAAVSMIMPASRMSKETELDAANRLKRTACAIANGLKTLPASSLRFDLKLTG